VSRPEWRAALARGQASGLILFGALLAAIGLRAEAQTFGRPVEATPAIRAIATTPTAPERSVLAAIDGQESTCWGAPEGATSAGSIIVLPSPRLIAGLHLSAKLSADSRLTVEWIDSLENKPFFGGTLSGPFSGERVLDLSLERVVTDRLLVTLSGPSVSLDWVAELVPLTFAGSPASRSLPPDDVVPGEGSSEVFAAEWLADGDVRTSWRVGSLETESFAEMISELGEEGANVFRLAARKAAGVSLAKAGATIEKLQPARLHPKGAIYEYRDPVSVERVKLYFTRGTRGSTEVLVETQAGWQSIALIPVETDFEGWVVSDLASPAIGTRFKVIVEYAGADAGDVTEMELWGTCPDRTPSIIRGETVVPSIEGEALFRLLPLTKRPYALEVIASGPPWSQISGHLNGQPVRLSCVSVADSRVLYQSSVNAADFDADELWLSVPEAGALGPLSCRLRAVDRPGEFFVGAGTPIADGSLLRLDGEPGTRQWLLDRKLAIDAIEVRGPAAASAMTRVRVQGAWMPLVPSVSGPDLAVVPCSRVIDGLELAVAGELSEVTLQGSPTTDAPPSIHVILPAGETADRTPVLLGTVCDPATLVTVNGLAPRRIGPWFWMSLDDADPHAEVQYRVELAATDTAGRMARLERNWYRWGMAPLTVDQASELQHTSDPAFEITGKTVDQQYSVEINGTAVPSNGNTFSAAVPVSVGFNSIVVAARRRTTGIIEAVRLVQVIRQNSTIGIEVTSPVPGSIVAAAEVTVSGRLIGAVPPVTATVNGAAAVVMGSTFSTAAPLQLAEGGNELLIFVRDGLGTEASAVSQVTVDTVPPVISFVQPVEDFLSAVSTVPLAVRATDASPLTVIIDGSLASGTDGLYRLAMSYADGAKDVRASAVDAAGNASAAAIHFMVDTTPPEPFQVAVDPVGWTEDTTPVVTFATTDATSGIARYEVSVDAGPGVTAISPFEVGPLPDGVHSIEVTAVDRAGNTQTVGAAARIDTVAPPAPEFFRGIEGPDQVELAWDPPADDVERYVIERVPAWAAGPVSVTGLGYVDNGLAAGKSFTYSIVAVDRAGHVSPPATDSSVVGIATSSVVDAEPGALVEFQNLKLFFSEESFPEGAREIVVTTVESSELEQAAVFGTASLIYDFTATIEDEGGVHRQEGVDFSSEYIGVLAYDPAALPDGFPEENVGLYYWDTTWSRWFPVENYAIDTTNHVVIFSTTHFTLFSVQPTVVQDLSPQELADVGFSPFKAQVTHGGITVSTQGGSAMTEATDLVLPGRAGFDFVLKRTYDTATARGDSPGVSINAALSFSLKNLISGSEGLADLVSADSLESILQQVGGSLLSQLQAKIESIFRNYGDYAFSTGIGWRLNFPYLRTGGSGVMVRTTSGAFYLVNNMDLKANEYLGAFPMVRRRLVLENHEGEDFSLEVYQALSATIQVGFPPRVVPSWAVEKAVLTMKDGSRCEFDSLGRVTWMEDATGQNRITFAYGGPLNYFLETITDSMGRVLEVDYDVPDSQDSFSIIPRIQRITLRGDPQGRKVVYGYTDRTLDGGRNPGVPLLGSVTDAEDRTWTYGYDRTPMLEGGVAINVNILQIVMDALGLGWLTRRVLPPAFTISGHLSAEIAYTLGTAEGPGIGYTRVHTGKDVFEYADVELSDWLFGVIPTGLKGYVEFPARLFTTSIDEHVSRTEPKLRTTEFAYGFDYAGHHQVVNYWTTVDDGLTVTTHSYEMETKRRTTYLTVEDWAMAAVQGIVMEPFIRTEYIPMENSFITRSPEGVEIERTVLAYDTASLRMTSREVSRGSAHSISMTWGYDGWGNALETTESVKNGAEEVWRTTSVTYFVKPVVGAFANEEPDGSPYAFPSLSRPRMDLATSQRITYSVPAVFGSATTASTQRFFDYDALGLRVAETSLVSGAALEMRFDYDEHGELTRVTSPAGQGDSLVTSISRDYSPSLSYIVTTVKEDVELSDGVTTDLETVVWYDRFSGLKRFERDARGYLSSYAYDAIGRPTETIEPADDDPLGADPLQGVSFLSDNPATRIVYDDAAFDVTVEGPRGQRETYDFDQAGRPAAIEKEVRKLDAGGSPLPADPQVQRTVVGYDGWGSITSIVDPNGRRTDYAYDLMRRLSGIVYPADTGPRPEKRIAVDYSTNTQTTTDERGFVSVEYFDMAGRRTGTLAYPDEPGTAGRAVRTTTRYDGMGRVALTIDELGGVTTTSYDERGSIVAIVSPSSTFYEAGAARTYSPRTVTTYDDGGAKLTETLITEGGEFQIIYVNNRIGLPLSMQRPYTDYANGTAAAAVARELYGYDQNGNRTLVADANDAKLPPAERKGKVTVYSARGKVLSETDRAGNQTTWAYDADDNPVLMTDPRGNDPAYSGNYRAEFWYDDVNRLVKAHIPSADGGSAVASVAFTYDPRGNLLARADADGSVTTYTYSSRNKPLTERKSDPGVIKSILTERTYDLSAFEIEKLVGGLYRTRMSYDGLGRVVRTELPSGSYEEYGYDAAGNRSRLEDGNGNAATYTYDSYRRLLVVTDALGKQRKLSYDARGNLTREIDANGFERLMTYDELGRIVEERRADGATSLRAYDAVGNLTWSRDAMGIETEYTYTDAYLVQQVVKREGAREQAQTFSWDRAGNRMSASNGSVTSLYNLSADDEYSSDPYGRVRAQRITIGRETFDAAWSYDEAGRVKQIGYPSGRTLGYLYDGIGLLEEVHGWTVPGSMRRDAAGRLIGHRLSNGVELEQGWNDDGRLVRLEYRGAGESEQLPSYSFGYDNAGDMTSNGSNTYVYDALRRLVRADEVYWPEVRQDEEAGAAVEDYTGQGQLVIAGVGVELALDRASTSIGADLGVVRDLVAVELHPSSSGHRVLARTVEVWAWSGTAFQKVNGVNIGVEPDGTLRAVFDEPVITSAIKVHCLYDERDRDDQMRDLAEFRNTNPNLLTIVYRMRRQRQEYTYDAKGNRLSVTKILQRDDHNSTTMSSNVGYWPESDRLKSYAGWTYVYDAKGRLVAKGTEYAEGVGFAESSGQYARYEWDLFDRLEAVMRSEAGTAGVVEVARYQYDADGMRVQKTAGAEVTRWAYGPDGNPVFEQSTTWTREFVYSDSKLLGYWQTTAGETRQYYTLTDHLGSVVSTTDELGAEVSKRDYLAFGGEAGVDGDLATPALYTGKEWDPEINLYYFNARWYDPELGRFISEDPIMDGPNWYTYCGNSPLIKTDPTGLGDLEELLNGARDAARRLYEKIQGSWQNLFRRRINTSSTPSDEYVIVPGDPTEYWSRKAEEARDSYKSEDTVLSASTGWEHGIDINKCNVFVDDTLYTDFQEIYSEAGLSLQSGNETAESWATNSRLERITATDSTQLLQTAMSYSDKGYLILFSYTNSDGSGHVGFLGTSSMAYNTIGDAGSMNGRAANTSKYPFGVAVQAGVYPGAAPMNFATNRLRDQISGANGLPRLTALDAQLKFYRVWR
jgi:RHS repeat-associated protein